MTGSPWRKSSYCADNNCVEVSGPWHKSSYSGETDCVEVRSDTEVAVRDSKDPDGPVLTFSRGAWQVFIDGVKRDR